MTPSRIMSDSRLTGAFADHVQAAAEDLKLLSGATSDSAKSKMNLEKLRRTVRECDATTRVSYASRKELNRC